MTGCYLCKNPATTVEHLPPKCFFAKPYPNNLITVPACSIHNNNFSKMDEWMRILLSAATDDNSTISLWHKICKGLGRDKSIGLKQKLLNSIVKINGIRGIDFDIAEYNDFIVRLTNGLYLYFFNEKISNEIKFFQPIFNPPLKILSDFKRLDLKYFKKGENFEVFYSLAKDDNSTSVWIYKFFKKNLFITGTIGLEYLPKN
ncbi:hypothetical protein ACFL23_04330 [Patescibacteria group bacterium]